MLPPPLFGRSAAYCGGIFTHAATSGLLAGTGLRQGAVRSLGMTAAVRLTPQYAGKSSSSSAHCPLQFAASQLDRKIPKPKGGAGGPGTPLRARGTGRPRVALGPLTLTPTHHCAGQRHRNEHSYHTHGLRSEEGATGCPISRSRKRPTGRASHQNAVGGRGAVSYKYRRIALALLRRR